MRRHDAIIAFGIFLMVVGSVLLVSSGSVPPEVYPERVGFRPSDVEDSPYDQGIHLACHLKCDPDLVGRLGPHRQPAVLHLHTRKPVLGSSGHGRHHHALAVAGPVQP